MTNIKKKSRWYTYQLIDPSDNSVFYVGKGTGSRINAHELEAAKGACSNKCKKIRQLLMDYGHIDKRIVAYFWDEQAAYDHETEIIEEIGLSNLTNVLPGGQKAWERRLVDRLGRKAFNPMDGLLFRPWATALWLRTLNQGEKIEVKGNMVMNAVLGAYFNSFLPMCFEKLNKSEANIQRLNDHLSEYGVIIT